MPAVILYIAVSLDGFIATPDGAIDWLPLPESPEEDYGYDRFYQGIDAVVMGRKTYEQVLTFGTWPYGDKPCWVCSQQLQSVASPRTQVTAQSPVALLADLAAQNCDRIWLVGGAQLIASFRHQGLITEYIVTVIPILLGAGIPLFLSPAPRETLQLIGVNTFTDATQLHYRRQ